MASSQSFSVFGYTIDVTKVPYSGKATTMTVDYRTVVCGVMAPADFADLTLGTEMTNKTLTVTIPAGGGPDLAGYILVAAVRPS
jgi:hypothetical protein